MNSPAHVGWHAGGFHADFAVVLALSALTATALGGLALTAYRRRRSRAYLLVLLALAALVARPLVAALAASTVVSTETHHLLEHGLDTAFVVLVLGAVYYARTVEKRLDEEET